MSTSGSKSNEHVAHFLVDIHNGIKHIKKNGTDLFADIEDKSKDEDKVLHLKQFSHLFLIQPH